jgi:SSS family solute:Na+ symporter
MGVEIFGLVAGLGFVLSFGDWCTDFLVVQRAMAADSMAAARRTPLMAAFPKMIMPFIVILPGIAALALSQMNAGYAFPLKEGGGGPDYDLALTTLMAKFYPSGMLGVGLTALMASFMSGMAGNARLTTIGGVALSIATAYLARLFNNIMDLLQLVFSFVNAPLFATFLLGMFWKRTTGHGAFTGLLAGTTAAAVTHGLTLAEGKGGWISPVHTFPSTMAQNFWMAIFAWSTCFVVTIVVSLMTPAKPESELRGLVYGLTDVPNDGGEPWYRRPLVLAAIVCVALVVLNVIFW